MRTTGRPAFRTRSPHHTPCDLLLSRRRVPGRGRPSASRPDLETVRAHGYVRPLRDGRQSWEAYRWCRLPGREGERVSQQANPRGTFLKIADSVKRQIEDDPTMTDGRATGLHELAALGTGRGVVGHAGQPSEATSSSRSNLGGSGALGRWASHLRRRSVDVRARPLVFVGVVTQLDTHRARPIRRPPTPCGQLPRKSHS